MKRLVAFLFLIVIVAVDLQGQNTSALNKFLDSLFSSFNKTTPGAAVTILQNGKVIAKKAYGMANLEHNIPFSHRSVTKQNYSEGREFISIATALMEQDGLLKLEDKVRKYFPKLPAWAEPVTIWDLLNHSSGFADEWAQFSLIHASFANRVDVSQFLDLLYNQPLPSVEPGKGYMYCNSDFGLLRLILEKVSGKNLSEWLKQRVFNKLKMNGTLMRNDPEELIPNRANVYTYSIDKTSPGANYLIYTNADDLEKWLAAHSDPSSEIAKATSRLLSGSREMYGMKNHFPIGYTVENIQGQKVIIHEGVNNDAYLIRIPSRGFAIISVGAYAGRQILDHYLKIPVPPEPTYISKRVPLSKDQLKKFTGRWRWDPDEKWGSRVERDIYSEFRLNDSILQFWATNQFHSDLIPVGNNIFYLEHGKAKVQFVFTEALPGKPMEVQIYASDGFKLNMRKDSSLVWKPSKEEMATFTGKYYSKHLDYYWTLELNEEGTLVIKRPTIATTVTEPYNLNQFRFVIESSREDSFDGYMLFHKDPQGKITHFTVWHPRLMHHRFDKIQ